jgi:hypothetical protein
MQSVYSWGKYLTDTVGTVVSTASASYTSLTALNTPFKTESQGFISRERKNSLNPKEHEQTNVR